MISKNNLKSLKKIPKEPSVLLLGIPGPGLIGTLSVSYLVHALDMEIVGEIENLDTTPVVFIDGGEIFGPIRIYRSGSLYAVLSDMPIDYEMVVSFVESLIEFAQKNGIDMIIMPNGIQATEKDPNNIKTFGLSTDESLESIMYENEIPKFLTGMIAGPDATILSRMKNSSIPCLVLFTQCNFFFPDPESALNSIKTVSSIIKRDVDLTEFKKQMNYLRLQGRQLMEDTLNVLQQEKEAQKPPQIYK
ncbi:MAG: proteasome assembly chaperone family protein [Thaumarchaeota archaeon]|nr:proteasome assembly chaperone family protein [Nitrososphaerota archaeon]